VPGTVAPDRVLRERYRLTREIAQGGIATVWEARDAVLDRPVAVKVLHDHFSADDEFAARFRREAVAAASLAHPNVVTTYDTGVENGVDFIVMEYVDGQTLDHILHARTTLPAHIALEVATHVADALAYAHSRGVMHCDLKPSNVLIRHDGQVKVSDFGLAKACGSDVTPSAYTAPEVVVTGCVDGRSDVYALGRILASMVADTGALDELIARATADAIEDRYASAADFAAALRDATVDRGEPTPAVGVPLVPSADALAVTGSPATTRRWRAWRPTRPAVALTLVIGLAAALVAFLVAERANVPLLGTPNAPAEAAIRVASVTDFDPDGRDHHEHPEATRFVIDGNPATAWTTERYRTRDFGVKPGVGVILTLENAAKVRGLEIDSAAGEWAGSVYVTDASTTAPGSAPDTLTGWGAPVASINAVTSHTVVTLDRPVSGRYVLIWVTQLPPARSLAIDEVRVAA